MASRISPHPDRFRPLHSTARSSARATRPGAGRGLQSGLRSRAEGMLDHADEAPPAVAARDRLDPAFEVVRHVWLEEELFFRVVRDAIDETDFLDVETLDLEPHDQRIHRTVHGLRRMP